VGRRWAPPPAEPRILGRRTLHVHEERARAAPGGELTLALLGGLLGLLAILAADREGQRPETLFGDFLAAIEAVAVVARFEAHQGVVHLVERLGLHLNEGKLQIVLDAVESSEADIQEDIEFALIQMTSETLNKVNDALGRLEQGDYGNCFECGEEIAEKRLRALPFAVRCKDCEEAKEVAERRERQLNQRRGSTSLFFDM
jgi:DnaK suppressor protein